MTSPDALRSDTASRDFVAGETSDAARSASGTASVRGDVRDAGGAQLTPSAQPAGAAQTLASAPSDVLDAGGAQVARSAQTDAGGAELTRNAQTLAPASADVLDAGYESARRVTRHHAKSFYFSSTILFGQRRRGAFALYAFCRRLDDLIDHPATQETPETLRAALDAARAMVHALFDSGVASPTGSTRDVFPEAELHALFDTVRRFSIPKQPFLDLIDGMEMDLTKHRYATWAELDLYCYRVAGVVGLMMAPLLGTTDPRALLHAADLGRAMQLTNILRDVKEDLARGRVYLPQDELAAAGITEDELRAGVVTPSLENFLGAQITRARALYASAAQGVPWLGGFGSMLVVRLMGSLYGGILDVIERRKLDIFSARASVSVGGKLWRLVKILFTPNPSRASGATT